MSNIPLFRLYDPKPDGLFNIRPTEMQNSYDIAKRWNEEKWGIFWCPNMNTTPDEDGNITREASRVTDEHINFWYCDIDEGTRDEQWGRIKRSPVKPSLLVKTKRGFHVYWRVDRAKVENFALIEKRIIEYFRADKRAKDIVRLLRMWSYNHWKDENDPFKVEFVMKDLSIRYTENQMLEAFQMSEDEKRALRVTDQYIMKRYSSSESRGVTIFEKIKHMDQMELLMRLSGTHYVGKEVYELRKLRSGNHNIIVNGKSTSCFVNKAGEIVADKHYGHNIINWLKWYNHTPNEIYQILRQIAPEAFE